MVRVGETGRFSEYGWIRGVRPEDSIMRGVVNTVGAAGFDEGSESTDGR
jgi:hypothetical protein